MSELSSFFRWVSGEVVNATPRRQLVIVAGSARGCGASTVASLVARAVAAEGGEALIVDTAGDASSLGRAAGPADYADTPQYTVVQDGVTHVKANTTARLRRVMPMIPRYDAAIVDAGSRIAPLRLLLASLSDGIRGSDQLLVVSSSAPSDCAAAYALIKQIAARPVAPRMHLLVNRSDSDTGARAYERVEAATRRFCRRSVAYAGALSSDTTQHDAAASDVFRRLLRPVPSRSNAPTTWRLLPAETR